MALPHDRRLRFTTGSWLTPLGRSQQRERDLQMRPVPEADLAELPRVTTPGGRELINGGGIFPDLIIEPDTLRLPEQEFVRVVSETQFPLGQRLQEFGFNVAATRRATNGPASVEDSELDAFISVLIEGGLPADLLAQPEVREYLHWQGELAVAMRMDPPDVGAEAEFRAERDRVLAEAIRLLSISDTQAALFREVDAVNASRAAAMPSPAAPAGVSNR
jgi:hypothetical protein